jgi:hypothetical protein
MFARMRDWLEEKPAGTDRSAAITALKRAAIGLVVVVLCAQFLRLMVQLKGDFDVHWESGRRIVAGEPLYAQQGGQDELGHNYPYPPFWALVHAPFSKLPILPAQLLLFPLIVLAGFGLIMTLNRVTSPHEPLHADRLFLVVAGAVFMSSRFLVRDMPECGVNLALVALSWLAVELWVQHRDWAGGWCLGLAISLKCTPALIWAWFLWKRQRKMAGATLAATGVFTLSPILVMGPAAYGNTMLAWIGHVERGIAASHPAYGVLGDEPLQNVSFRPAMARYLTVLPEGHRSRIDHPLYFDGLNLPPRIAGGIIKGLLLGLVVAVGFLFRQRVTRRSNPTWLWEAATVSVLILLLSPITWGQHCVGVLPAFYLLMRRRVFGKPLPGWTKAILWGFIAGMLLLNRELIGKDLTYLLDSCRLPTLFLLGVLLVMLRIRNLVAEECQEPALETIPAQANHARTCQPPELATNH